MSMPEQLRIAHKLALATLQFHATPWTKDEWDIQDIGLFLTLDSLDETALQTLHLSAQFLKNSNPGYINGSNRPTHQDSKATNATISRRSCYCTRPKLCRCNPDLISHDALLYGVDNMMLCSLGITLLQIGHRRPLQELQTDKDPNKIYTARRLAYGSSPLGPKFQNIIRKCLRCDFGSGTDLASAELQSAVFSDVVCELEEKISSLSS